MNWYYIEGDNKVGPITAGKLGRLIEAGKLTESSLVRREDSKDWTRLIDSGLVEVKAESPLDTQPPQKAKVHEAVESTRHMKKCIVLSVISFVAGFGLAVLLNGRYEFKFIPYSNLTSVNGRTYHEQFRIDNFTGKIESLGVK